MQDYIFTSESVSEGHPDKICDTISDAILDLYLARDPFARVACETMVTKDYVFLAGETRSQNAPSKQDIEQCVRQTIRNIGYLQNGFHADKITIKNVMHTQSEDIAVGVDTGQNKEEGAGDQGIMFGYACRETETYMPAPIYYASKILRRLAEGRHSGEFPIIGPDAKSQVSLDYTNYQPTAIDTIVISTQHTDTAQQKDINDIVHHVINDVIPEQWLNKDTVYHINPTGRFVIGGPVGDAGLTGRKIIVDTYGGSAPHGGGAFSGKDPTKVDRSAAYAARYLAKNIVAAGLAEKCLIQFSFAIGVARPVAIYINTFGTGQVDEHALARKINDVMDLSTQGIRRHLKLNQPIYTPSATYGHFGRQPRNNGAFSWEKLDLVDQLK